MDVKKIRIRRGFSLVELMIVISIIGILSVLTMIGLRGMRNRASDVQKKSDVASIGRDLEAYNVQKGGKYPISNADGTNDGTTESLKTNSPTALALKTTGGMGTVPVANSGLDESDPWKYYQYSSVDGKEYILQGNLAEADKYVTLQGGSRGTSMAESSQKLHLDNYSPIFDPDIDVLSVEKNGNSAILYWGNAYDDSGTVRYKIDYSIDDIEQPSIANIKSTSYVFLDMQPKQYNFTIKAYDLDGNEREGETRTINWASADTTPPAFPGPINAYPINDDIILAWNNVSDAGGLASYIVDYQLAGGAWTNYATASTGHDYMGNESISLYIPGANYDFRIRAVDTSGNCSDYVYKNNVTVAASGKTDVIAPVFPPDSEDNAIIQVEKVGNQYNVSWAMAVDNVGIDHYRVYYDDYYGGSHHLDVAKDQLSAVLDISAIKDIMEINIIAYDAAGNTRWGPVWDNPAYY